MTRGISYKTLEDAIGHTPLVQLQRLPGAAGAVRGNVVLGKLEGNNPAGSVKDRPAISMIMAKGNSLQTLTTISEGRTVLTLSMKFGGWLANPSCTRTAPMIPKSEW